MASKSIYVVMWISEECVMRYLLEACLIDPVIQLLNITGRRAICMTVLDVLQAHSSGLSYDAYRWRRVEGGRSFRWFGDNTGWRLGGSSLPRSSGCIIDGRGDAPPHRRAEPAELTDRESEVLVLVARAASNAEIARRLVVTEATVKTHVSAILRELNVPDRVHAVVAAYDLGLVRPRPSA